MCLSLSLSKLWLEKRHGVSKKIWTHEGPSKRKIKKKKKTLTHEGPSKRKRKIAVFSKEFT
jgi:hypothetical protein